MTKTAENHTLWGRTYLYSPYKGVHPPPRGFSKGGLVILLCSYKNENALAYKFNSFQDILVMRESVKRELTGSPCSVCV